MSLKAPPLAAGLFYWVLIRDPAGKFDTQALLYTTCEATPLQVLEWVMLRWQVEVTFEAARARLGMETQRQWSTGAVARTTPCVLGLYALITLLAARVYEQQGSQCATMRGTPKSA